MNTILDTLEEIRLDLLEGLDIPHALSLAICQRYQQWDQLYVLLEAKDSMLCSSSIIPHRNISYERAFLQANALYSKADDIPEQPNLHEKAILSFLECEAFNKETNIRFLTGAVSSPLIYTTSLLLKEMLGDFSEMDWAQNFRFGPGSSSTCRGSSATIAHKLESTISCTPRAFERVERGFRHFFQYYYALRSFSTTEPWNYFLTVPKNFKSRRAIAIAQHGNIVGQLAMGTLMKRKFRRFQDIDTAAHNHGQLVRQKWRSIATIDLRSASQLIASRAVKSVFPADWLEAMDDLREEYTYIPNTSHTIHGTDRVNYNQHYSAMGNGFTFEMETLLFYSVAKAAMLNAKVKWKVLSVFGDDIIVDKEHAHIVIAALENFGFQINHDKTFIEGPFKESCGVDTLYGCNVRPHFLRNYLQNKENKGSNHEQRFKLTNTIFRIARNSGHGLCLDARFYRAWIRSVSEIPEQKRFFAGEPTHRTYNGFGQEVLDNSTLYYAAGRQPAGLYNKYRLVQRFSKRARYFAEGEILLGAALLGATSDGIIPRGASPTTRTVKLRYIAPSPSVVWVNLSS